MVVSFGFHLTMVWALGVVVRPDWAKSALACGIRSFERLFGIRLFGIPLCSFTQSASLEVCSVSECACVCVCVGRMSSMSVRMKLPAIRSLRIIDLRVGQVGCWRISIAARIYVLSA